MDTMNANIHCCVLTILTDLCFYFSLCFLYHLFDSCRMDTSINDQFLQSNSGDLTADRIKGR